MNPAHLEDAAERIGRLADTADNYLEYALPDSPFARLESRIRFDALKNGLSELRDALRAIAIDLGADPETWVTP